MPQPTDQDGKSKTASAADSSHYLEQHEVSFDASQSGPNREDIARRAHELWRRRGCPEGSAKHDWVEAEEQLRAKANSENARPPAESGSVQR